MSPQHRGPLRADDGYRRPTGPAPVFIPQSFDPAHAPLSPEGQLAWEATETAPVEWVPFVYTAAQESTMRVRRRLSVSSVVLGVVGLAGALLGVFGLPFSAAAVATAIAARITERRAGQLWFIGLVTGVSGLVIGAGWLMLIARVIVPLL